MSSADGAVGTEVAVPCRKLELIPSDVTSRTGELLHVESSVIVFRWCLSPDLLSYIREQSIAHPMILFVTVNLDSGRELSRKLVPLTEMMAFVPFTAKGKNRVLATIVYPKTGVGVKRVFKEILSVSGRSYSYTLLPYGSDHDELSLNWGFDSSFNYIKSDEESTDPLLCTMDFDIDEKFFAKEPSDTMKWWVNLFFGGEMPVDQCDFRKRRIFAYSVQPFLVLGFLIAKYFVVLESTAIALFRGVVDINWDQIKGNLRHPFSYYMSQSWEQATKHKTYWEYKRNGKHWDGYSKRKGIIPWLRPSMLFFYAGIGVGLWVVTIWVPAWIVATVSITFVLFVAVVMVSVNAIMSADAKAMREAMRKAREEGTVNREREELSGLLCTTDIKKLKPELKALPANKRTLKLRFLGTKRLLCRPYSK